MGNRRRRLSENIAVKLGLKVKQPELNGKSPRYTLTAEQDEEVDRIMLDRDSTIRVELSQDEYDLLKGIRQACNENGVGLKHIAHGWLKQNNSSVFFKNPLFVGSEHDQDFKDIKKLLEEELDSIYTYTSVDYKRNCDCVVKIADLHFGAMIADLLRTKDFNSDILKDYLNEIVNEVNSLGFKKVHVHIHGDLIESFSGLNHINSWLSLNKDEVGANAVKLCTKLLDEFLRAINNLGSVKIVAGNHDRTSKRNDEDVQGQAADLIAWGLELIGYNIEFHPMVLTHVVDNINYIILHGDRAISKQDTSKIIWDYGIKGMFNYVAEGHLHSIIKKLSAKTKFSNFKLLKDDALDHRREILPSLFTGNFYSESLGFTSNAGFQICYNNGKDIPTTITCPV